MNGHGISLRFCSDILRLPSDQTWHLDCDEACALASLATPLGLSLYFQVCLAGRQPMDFHLVGPFVNVGAVTLGI